MGVIIGMDPHQRPATIEVAGEHAHVLAVGRYGTGKAGYGEMLKAGRKSRTGSGRLRAAMGPAGTSRTGPLVLRSIEHPPRSGRLNMPEARLYREIGQSHRDGLGLIARAARVRPRSSSATAPSTKGPPTNAPAQSDSSSTVAPITAPTSGVT
jgi:hypothetical protein